MVVDDIVDGIVDVINNRFDDFGFMLSANYADSYDIYSILEGRDYDVNHMHEIVFYYDCLVYLQHGQRGRDLCKLYYDDLDIDVLVGLFLCKAYYNG